MGRSEENPSRNSIVQKSFVASSGALITSLLVTPLEVVKTRLQAQEYTNFSPTVKCPQAKMNYCNCSHVKFSNGLMDCMVPRNVVKCVSTNRKLTGTLDALSYIVRTEGIPGIYSGLPPTLLLAIPSTVFYFTSYDYFILKARDAQIYSSAVPLFAGSLARSIAATIVSPLELLRTRLQSRSVVSSSNNSLVHNFRKLIVKDGVLSLWRGLGATLARDVPFSAIYWTSFELLKEHFHDRGKNKSSPGSIAFMSGALSGSIATVFTQPFDVVKTRQQISYYSVDKSTRNTGFSGTFKSIKQIVLEEGYSGLMTGVVPRVAKVAPACAIMISSYEFGKSYLNVQ